MKAAGSFPLLAICCTCDAAVDGSGVWMTCTEYPPLVASFVA